MEQHHGRATIELGEQRLEAASSQVGTPVVRQEHDAVASELVEGVNDLGKRAVEVRQRQAS
jgi:hypothetical protein